ncbi:MAG: NUDIX domain-containing protein [Agitococcus sp.]|nr:NUDIX domain-containing protein [Agitococcus sp.]
MTTNGFTRARDVEIVEQRVVYQGFSRLDIVRLRHRQFAGGMGVIIQRELLMKPEAVGVLIYDPKRDEVLMIEQFRVGALSESNPWQLEIVAGLVDSVDEDETLEAVVCREALEEASIELRQLQKLMSYFMSPGGSNEKFTLFVAQADLSDAGGLHGLPEEGEDIRVTVLKSEVAFQALMDGRVSNAPALIALQWLMLNKQHLGIA